VRSSNGHLAHGTVGNPQTNLLQKTYAAIVAQNEARLKEELEDEPLVKADLLEEMRAKKLKFTQEDVMFTTRDTSGQIVWLEKGNVISGYAHIEARGHVGQIAKQFGVAESEVPKLLRNIVRDGRIIKNEIRKSNGRDGYERVYEYKGEYLLLAGIGLNGFLVSAYPLGKREAD
jgi:hypothetical protein